ncbi:S53 family peptidase [Actinospica robiniae]|uniref:S53 family peptidase n=1 Tax=Actinospica robiniae TaxID=304901 RepID=UPI0007C57E69|nr:S53 family peptidase [Actinospica robiniae]
MPRRRFSSRSPFSPPPPRSARRKARRALCGITVTATGLCLAGSLTLGSGDASAAPLSALAAASAAASASTATAAGSGTAASALVSVAGVRPGWATAASAQGAAPSGALTTRVFLGTPDAKGLAAYATAVSTPGGSSYRHYLSTSAAAKRYGPSAAEASDVSAWLRKQGLTVTSVTGQYVSATGSVSAVDHAYGITLRSYALPGGGSAVAPDRDPQIPASLAPSVATITGLTSASLPMYAQHVTAAAASQDLRTGRGGGKTPTGPLIPTPCSDYYGQVADTTDPAFSGVKEPYTVCGYSASQLRSAYGAVGHSGRDATVAIVDAYASGTMLSDADTWSSHNKLPAFAPGQYTQVVTQSAWNNVNECGGTAGWAAEESLDVEAVHAMAPSAKVLYYGANSCQDSDLLAALTDLITHHRADVISDSWGGPLHSTAGDESASTIAEYEHLFQLAAVEGITVNFSSGDCGANDPATSCGSGEGSSYAQTTFPASDPWVTAVGGTSAAVNAHGKLAWSTSWGTDAWLLTGNGANATWQSLGWIFGGGGGASADFPQPHYQRADVPSSLAKSLLTGGTAPSARRVVPDLSLDADPFTGMLVGQTQQLPTGATGYAEAAIGGTSLASPLLAGLEADAITERGGAPLGFINPTLYWIGPEHHGSVDALHDVLDKPSGVATPIAEVFPPYQGQPAAMAGLGDDLSLHAGYGYDDATGIGTPGPLFIEELAAG